jgi:hypothetical protein
LNNLKETLKFHQFLKMSTMLLFEVLWQLCLSLLALLWFLWPLNWSLPSIIAMNGCSTSLHQRWKRIQPWLVTVKSRSIILTIWIAPVIFEFLNYFLHNYHLNLRTDFSYYWVFHPLFEWLMSDSIRFVQLSSLYTHLKTFHEQFLDFRLRSELFFLLLRP